VSYKGARTIFNGRLMIDSPSGAIGKVGVLPRAVTSIKGVEQWVGSGELSIGRSEL